MSLKQKLRLKLSKFLELYGYEIVLVDKFRDFLKKEYDKSNDFCFMQIGANDGVKFDFLYDFFTTHKCRGVVVEPLSYYFNMLKENYASFPEIVPIQCAVHSTKKKASIYYVDPEKLASLPESSAGIGSLFANLHKKAGIPIDCMISEEVECVHLMNIVKEHNLYDVSFLQIDVEGYDAEVIRMIDFNVIQPKLIKYEHCLLKRRDRWSIRKLLKSKGYDLFYEKWDTIAVCRSK